MAVVDVDVRTEDVGHERQAARLVDELEERVVEPCEREAVERSGRSCFRLPDAIDGSLQPLQLLGAKRSRHDHEAVSLELLPHRL